MKILFVALSKEIKTGARYTEEIIRQAFSQRHKVDFLYPYRNGNGTIATLLSLLFFGYLPLLKRSFYDLIFTSDNFVFADIVYVQPPAGKDVILTWDEMLFGGSFKQYLRWLPCLTQRPLKALIAKHACFVTNSNYAREIVKRNFGKDALVVYPPVPTYLYPHFERNRENVVVTISSLNPRKNLKLIAEVGKRIPEAKFVLLGYYQKAFAHLLKEIEAEFESLGLKDNFAYIPSSSNQTKVSILSKAKVYFHPTLYEPFGISIAEGMAAGCIPVVHNSGGPREFVPDEWRYQEVEEAAAKIRQALKSWNIPQATELRSLAFRFGEERFKQEILELVEQNFIPALERNKELKLQVSS